MLIALALVLQTTSGTCDVTYRGTFCQSVPFFRNSCPVTLLHLDATLSEEIAREKVEAKAVQQHAATAAEWFALACTRSTLIPGVRSSQHMLDNQMFRRYEDAIKASIESVKLDGDSASLTLLTGLVLTAVPGRPDADLKYTGRVTTIAGRPDDAALDRYGREALELLQPYLARHADAHLLRGCSELALAIRNYPVAHECIERSLLLGADSTWNLLRLTWLAVRRADTAGAVRLFRRAVAAANDPVAANDLGWHFNPKLDSSGVWAYGPTHASEVALRERTEWVDTSADLRMAAIASWSRSAEGSKIWHRLDSDTALADHFRQLAFAGEAFRDCVVGEPNPPCGRGPEPVALAVRRMRFWDPHGDELVVVPYQLIGGKAPKVWPAGTAIEYRQRNDRDHFGTDTTFAPRESARGLVIIPTPPDLDSWMMSAVAPGFERVAAFEDGQLPLSTGALRVSDLAVGAIDSIPVWDHDGTKVPMSPTLSFDRRVKIALFYQLRCDSGCGPVHTSISLYALPDRGEPTPALAVGLDGLARPGITDVTREIDVARLAHGNYRLEVAVRGAMVRRNIVQSVNIRLE
jgi:hypothetical protein